MSFSSSSHPFYLLFNNVFAKEVPIQHVANPVTRSSYYCVYDVPFFLAFMQCFLVSHTICPTDLHPSAAPLFENFTRIFNLLPEISHVSAP
jgi:hypothetical protein